MYSGTSNWSYWLGGEIRHGLWRDCLQRRVEESAERIKSYTKNIAGPQKSAEVRALSIVFSFWLGTIAQQLLMDVPGAMSIFVSTIAIRAKALQNDTGVVGFWNDWWAVQELEARKNKISASQQRLPLDWYVIRNQIPVEWHQVAVKLRRANGIKDGDVQFSI